MNLIREIKINGWLVQEWMLDGGATATTVRGHLVTEDYSDAIKAIVARAQSESDDMKRMAEVYAEEMTNRARARIGVRKGVVA